MDAENSAPGKRESTGRPIRSNAQQARTTWALVLLFIGFFGGIVQSAASGDAFAWFEANAREVEYVDDQGVWHSVGGSDPPPGARGYSYMTGIARVNGVVLPLPRCSLVNALRRDWHWVLAIASFGAMPLAFVSWRFTGHSFLRAAGLMLSLTVVTSVPVLMTRSPFPTGALPSGAWWSIPIGAVLMAVAFVVGPSRATRRDDDPLEVRRLLRRHRAEA